MTIKISETDIYSIESEGRGMTHKTHITRKSDGLRKTFKGTKANCIELAGLGGKDADVMRYFIS